ncbi:Prostatic spermine-binding protein [Candidatus Terasakiella magnetica]|nr:Prostatic spermine-binding protein [Candidatus Terasakiella magnetica]
MRKSLWVLTVLPLLAGPAAAADGPGLGTIFKDAATQAAGQAARDTIDKTVPKSADRDYRDKDRGKDKDRDYRDRDRRDAPGNSYEHRRDGRGRDDNPGRGRDRD